MAPKYLETKADFDKALKDNCGKLIVIDFTASWCGPCKMIAPKFEAMAAEFTDVCFFKVDVDNNSEVAEAEDISAMPTFVFYKKGYANNKDDKTYTERITGANEARLRGKIEELI